MSEFKDLMNRRNFLKTASLGCLTLLSACNEDGNKIADLLAAQSGECLETIVGRPHDTRLTKLNVAKIDGVGDFQFDPTQVETVRPDLFNLGYFSLFDLLVHLADKGKIEMKYHFDAEMDTNIIDDLNGSPNWWYQVWYNGGWPEKSFHRMDYYPVKDKMRIALKKIEPGELERRREVWRTEVARRDANGGKIIVPEVQIRDKDNDNLWTFENVEVKPHDLRPDFFVEGTVTAADIIMSLGDIGKITYQMLWYDNIGNAEIKNYYVECINNRIHSGMCGFVYEVGEEDTIRGNHIHVTPDIRILQSPGYALFYWIKLGPCS
jgi:hypothetical protein